MKTIYYTLTAVSVTLAAAVLAWLYWRNVSAPAPYSANNPVYQALVEQSPSFVEAERLRNSDRSGQAVPLFQEALQNAKDPAQEGQIKIKIAVSVEKDPQAGGYMAAIPLLKDIAANARYTNITRAYAVQELALLFYVYGDGKITDEIFKDAPYQSMAVAGDAPLSYRHLFEYASSFYKLANPELRIADWYASQVYKSARQLPESDRLSPATVASYKDIIRGKIASAAVDIDRITNLPNEKSYVPNALQREAAIFSKLQLSGDNSFGDAVATMQKVLNIYSTASGSGRDGYARYYYALYLAKLRGPSTYDEARKTLAPLYSDTPYIEGRYAFAPFLRNARVGATESKPDIVLLAGVDPKFKDFLITLGWTEADFK